MADKKQIIGALKKNAVSVTAGVVAAAAIAAALLFPPGWLAQTQQQITSRVSVAEEVEKIGHKATRKTPLLHIDASEAPPLVGFPNKATLAAGEAALKALKDQADAVLAESAKLGGHTALVPEVFTEPNNAQANLFKFRDEYNAFMPARLNASMNAGLPLLPEDISVAMQKSKDEINRTLPIHGAGGTVLNQDAVNAAILDVDTRVPREMREKLANEHAVYANRDAWVPYAGMAESASGVQPQPADVWLAQLGLWIQQDIAHAIAETNAGSKSVVTSPVKHLIKVQLAPNPYVVPRGSGTDVAIPVTGINPAAPVVLNRAASITGHVPNGLYDVCRYTLVVRVSESHVAEFLAQIPRGRLHYVTNVDLRTIDANLEAAPNSTGGGLTYGRDPVVELAVDVEVLFLRKPLETIMPKTVKQMIGIEAAAAPTPG